MNKKAFSLVELSVVVVIVSILVAGIFMGSGLVRNARMANAKSHTTKSVVKDIDGLISWYETTTKDSFEAGQAHDNSQITRWYDIAPSSEIGLVKQNFLSTAASANVVFLETGINDIPAIEFSGTGNLTLSNFYQGSSAARTIFLVFRPLSLTTQTILDSVGAGATASISIKDSNEVTLNAGSSVSTATASNPANFAISDDYVMAVYFDGSNSRVYINDGENEIGAGNINPGNAELTGLTIGTNKSNSSGYSGLISEIIIFDRPLKIQARKDIMAYLATKYKISVSNL